VDFIPLNNFEVFEQTISSGEHCAVIIEAIQGVGGLDEPTSEFYQFLLQKCQEQGVLLIADEVQSGFGRSGHFFAFQQHTSEKSALQPDVISIAKGMGNGFPVGGVLVHPRLKPWFGMLGTTFGGNHLACAATLAVLEVIEQENLMKNAGMMGTYFKSKTTDIPHLKKLKGRGLMLGLEFDFDVAELRKKLIYEHKMFTGGSANKNLLRFLPALNIHKNQIDRFFAGLHSALETIPLKNNN
jgi:acetylornithine/N-succinyldiaminopimelate aminotransferase